MFPHDPDHMLAAVTHAAPFDYYRRLAEGPPLRFDAGLDCWLAAAAAYPPCWSTLTCACGQPGSRCPCT